MSSKTSGPRFSIGSTKPSAGTSVVDELIGRTPPQAPPITSDGEIVGTIAPPRTAAAAPAVAKFGNDDTPPTLEECEQHIRTVTTQWLIGVGLALRAIRDHELYKQVGYDSFGSYLRHRLDMGAPQASRLIQSVPVVEALEGRTDREIKEGQARVLVPVLKHGEQAVREVWDAAAHSGYPSAKSLERVAREKGYLNGQPDPESPQPPPPGGPASTVLVRYQKALTAFEDLRGLSQLAKEEPTAARHIAAKLREALNELEADLPKDEAPTEE
ncbi:hypothetical protein ACQP1V_43050 (plasmid) [Microtetraspora malaysiensis]|uniref:hypothetical protein n=1 Tax=Microtetraspora malaysiensis TaxID=161358 RepID=UPI003D8F1910